MGYFYNSCSSVLRFLQTASVEFTTAAPDGGTVTQMGLDNSSIHFVERIRWKIVLGTLNKSEGSISLGLDSIDMFLPI